MDTGASNQQKNGDVKQPKATANQASKQTSFSNLASGTRRSKRVRKGKIDYEIVVSSYDTIKKAKLKVSQ